MHVNGFLHKLLSPVMHQKRLDTLKLIVSGLLANKRLSVTELGRSIELPIQERSAIRRSDRFIGNVGLHKELKFIYGQQIQLLINARKRPKIIVDWTHVPNTKNHAIRAALVATGRAVTVYEEVHTEKKLGNAKVEKKFLLRLQELLPADCRPVIITDAGFRNPWFMQVLELGWDYIGRIRGTQKYYNSNRWIRCRSLLSKATLSSKCVGNVLLCKKNMMTTNLFLYKEKRKKRYSKKRYRRTQGGSDRLHYCKSMKESWLLASSLTGNKSIRVVKLYKRRMQIEEGFRDLKSPKFGFGLRYAYSRTLKRIAILLLIAALASLIAWLVGCFAEEKNWQYQYQVNSQKKKRVLSLFYLGCRVINRNKGLINDMLKGTLETALRYAA